MNHRSRRNASVLLLLSVVTGTIPVFAQSSDAAKSFNISEIDKMKETCLSIEQQQFFNDRMRSNRSTTELSAKVSPTDWGGSVKHDQESQARDINSGGSYSASNCDGVIRSYFEWKSAQLYADAMKANGSAIADAYKSTGQANADATKSVGLASAAAMESVGLANSKAQMYTGIAGAAGGLLGSLFTSGNQKAAVKAQANAEVEKAKIAAQVELEKARMQYDLMKGQGAGAGYPQPYQQRQYVQPSHPESVGYQQQYVQQNHQSPTNQHYSQPYPPQYVSQQPYIQPNPQQNHQAVALSTFSATKKSTNQQSNSTSALRKYIASLRLVEDPACNPGSVVIMSSTLPRICAFPSSIMPGGTYIFDGARMVKY